MPKRVEKEESLRPITVEDHIALAGLQLQKKQTAVDDALGFPDGNQFEAVLDELLKSDAEANGEVITIALIDLDSFDHINKDFGREEGDRMIIAAGRYIQDTVPKEAMEPKNTRMAPIRRTMFMKVLEGVRFRM